MGTTTQRTPDNRDIADALTRVADLLHAQNANPFRVRAYHRAARAVEASAQSIAELAKARENDAVEGLPDIGKSIGASIRELVHSGRLALLDRLEGNTSPEALLATVPGIGPKLGERIHNTLDVDTLEELELAAHDGRLHSIQGIGDGRLRIIRNSLSAILSQSSRRRARREAPQDEPTARPDDRPSANAILAVDKEYREKAEADELRKIAPRRFNPEGEAWLPILHTEREDWNFTALYSNTSRAHELGRTGDWVVVYYERDGREGQCTVVSEYQGSLRGKRVIRGRERECKTLYEKT